MMIERGVSKNLSSNQILWPHFHNREFLITSFKKLFPNKIDKIIKDADEICKHNFNFLSGNLQHLGEKINWHKDFISGYVWDNKTFYKDIRYGHDFTGNADVIIPWELSRFQHLFSLGKAYLFTSQERYTEEFVKQIEDWIKENPVGFGVNWVSPMDVGIRAINWIISYLFFHESTSIINSFRGSFFENLEFHALYLLKNIKRKQNNNHRIAGFLGLLFIGLFLYDSKNSKRWIDYGLRGLIKGMREQVYSDGVDYEGSIHYHKLVTEIFLSAAILCEYKRINLPDIFLGKLEKMLDFIVIYTPPNAQVPQIGDSDDGRMHILSDYYTWERRDHRYLLSIGAALFNRPDFTEASGSFHEESFWLLGEKGYHQFCSLADKIIVRENSSKAYQNGGYYIMREKDLYMIVDCLPFDKKALTGHRHNSRLSFEMHAYGKSFIVDPGTYVYTSLPKWRNKFRSTAYHNTGAIDAIEQNEFMDGNIFWLSNHARTTVNEWVACEEYDLLDVQHTGLRRLKDPIVHRRIFLFHKIDRYWIVVDKFSGSGKHSYAIFLHFSPIAIRQDPQDQFVVQSTCPDSINICVIPLEKSGLSLKLYTGWVSAQYGEKMEAPVLEMSKTGIAPQYFVTLVYPFMGENLQNLDYIQRTAVSYLNKHIKI